MSVKIGKMVCKNPILTASGTFGYGLEFDDFFDVETLGGIIVKGTTLNPREGNPYPRMTETASGMLNAVGLQNKGVNVFINNILPKIQHYQTNIIVNVSGSNIKEYLAVTKKIEKIKKIPAIELNISCPNVKMGGMAFGTSCSAASQIVRAVRKIYSGVLIVKLSPNVTNIAEIAKAVENAGADAISAVNTFLGMAIDINTKKPKLSTITGGLSGPAIKPIALRMVWQISKAVKIPIIGLGGIMNGKDAIEFMLAGATAVQIGTANFIDPTISFKIIEEIRNYCIKNNISDVKKIISGMKTK